VRWRLAPLTREEAAAYVRHRLSVSAGVARDHVFSDAALTEVYRFSGGVPRLVNLVCDRALLAAYSEGSPQIGADVVRRAAVELAGDRPVAKPARARWLALALGLGAAAALAAGVGALGGPRAAWERIETLRGVAPPVTIVVEPAAPIESSAPAAPAPADAVAAPLAPDVAAAPPPAPVPTPAPEAPPAAPAVQRVDDLGRALAERAPGATVAASYAALLSAWSIAPEAEAQAPLSFPEVEAALAEQGLGVFSFAASDLDQLRVLDHPVLLDVEAADGVPRVVAVRGIGADEAELAGVAADGPVRVSLEELQRVWLGDAHLVWRDFETLPELIRPGDRGEAVSWLQASLVEVGRLRGTPNGSFDAATEAAVRSFQTEHGLDADGAVGPLTKMALYRALGRYDVPHLAAATPKGDAG
jgi:general secretion pathway protein A